MTTKKFEVSNYLGKKCTYKLCTKIAKELKCKYWRTLWTEAIAGESLAQNYLKSWSENRVIIVFNNTEEYKITEIRLSKKKRKPREKRSKAKKVN